MVKFPSSKADETASLELLWSTLRGFSVLFSFCSCSVANPITVVGCLLERMETGGKRRHRTSKRIMTSRKCSGRKLLVCGCESRCRSRCSSTHQPQRCWLCHVEDAQAPTLLVTVSHLCIRAVVSEYGVSHEAWLTFGTYLNKKSQWKTFRAVLSHSQPLTQLL